MNCIYCICFDYMNVIYLWWFSADAFFSPCHQRRLQNRWIFFWNYSGAPEIHPHFLGGFEGFHGTIHESRNCGFLIVFETPPKHHWKLNVCRWGQYGWIKQVHLWMFLESRAHGNCDLVSIACKETSDLLIDDWEDQERLLFFSQIYWVSQKYQLVCFLKKRYELLTFQVFLGAASKAHANNPSFLSANDEGNCLTQTKFIIEELRAYPSTWCLESARKTWTLHLLTGCYTSFIDPLQKKHTVWGTESISHLIWGTLLSRWFYVFLGGESGRIMLPSWVRYKVGPQEI